MNMPDRGEYTQREILSQPEAWAAALEVLRPQAESLRHFFQAGRYENVLFTGCGSTYYLSLAAAAVFQELSGLPARGLPASEVWLQPCAAYVPGRKTLLVAVSRSGETTETVRACEAFRAAGGEVLTLSCYPGRAMTRLGQVNLVLPSGQEESLAQTRAFSTLYLASVALAALWAGHDELLAELHRLSEPGRRVLDQAVARARDLGTSTTLDRFYFLGSGARYGLACELSLKMKEMSLSHSEPFHTLEYRHGPKSMVTPGTLIVGLLDESGRAHETAVLDEMRTMGARVITVGEQGTDVVFASGLSAAACGVLYLPFGQCLGYERSLAKGLNPDLPNNLDKVVKLP
jgi:glucosamine--fructose-6-phosphate aminotransferase (isomerizing)